MVTVAIDARLVDGQVGGVQQTILGLALGLAKLDDRGDEYLFLVFRDHDWLAPALTGPCRPLVARTGGPPPSGVVRKAVHHLLESRGRVLPRSDGTVEAANADAIHFMLPRGFRTDLPNIYQPHDLQHLHHPSRFSLLQRTYRRMSYPAMARQASRVAVMTNTSRAATAADLGIPASKVVVVPWASIMSLYDAPAASRTTVERLGLPGRFLLYPAHTWVHKNHLGLVRALGVLRRDHDLSVPLVLTGARDSHWLDIANEIRRQGVQDLVSALGFVQPQVLRRLYLAADALIFPSLYEGWGQPIVEAFDMGLPVLCSDITPLKEIASDAAFRFAPHDPADIARAISIAWTDRSLLEHLARAGKLRARAFSWETTAALLRAHYRDILGLPPKGRDTELLRAPGPA